MRTPWRCWETSKSILFFQRPSDDLLESVGTTLGTTAIDAGFLIIAILCIPLLYLRKILIRSIRLLLTSFAKLFTMYPRQLSAREPLGIPRGESIQPHVVSFLQRTRTHCMGPPWCLAARCMAVARYALPPLHGPLNTGHARGVYSPNTAVALLPLSIHTNTWADTDLHVYGWLHILVCRVRGVWRTY